MSPHAALRSALIWLAVILFMELTPLIWHSCPWGQLTGTVREGIRWWHPVATLVLVILVILWGHFDENWRVRYLLAAGVVGVEAILIHILVRK